MFLHHNYATDVLTFDYSEKKRLLGDIYICFEVISENALQFNTIIKTELLRVMFHAFLHLLGYNDTTPEQQQTMGKEEDNLISLFHVEQ